MKVNTTAVEIPNEVYESDHSPLDPGFNPAFWPGRDTFEDMTSPEVPDTDTEWHTSGTATSSKSYIAVSPYAPIDALGISFRASNALKRHGDINTIADLIHLVDAGKLPEVRNIGVKSVAEIEDILSRVHLIEPIKVESDAEKDLVTTLTENNQALQVENAHLRRELTQLVVVQASAIRRQLASRSLHKDALVLGKSIADWLELVNSEEVGLVISALSTILTSSTNVCDELAYTFNKATSRDITVLLSRYGGIVRTLDEIGKDMNLTRERVRQLCVRIAEDVECTMIGFRSTAIVSDRSVKDFPVRPPLVRIQSALLRAKDMGLDISFAAWKEDILTSGLVGRLEPSHLRGFDPVELMLATCKASRDFRKNSLVIPENGSGKQVSDGV